MTALNSAWSLDYFQDHRVYGLGLGAPEGFSDGFSEGVAEGIADGFSEILGASL